MTPEIAHLRDRSPVGAWLLKAKPSIWDIGAALTQRVELDWWRLAPTYRADLVHEGHPCAIWVTRGDPRVRSGLWAIGEVVGEPFDDAGDPEDPLWLDEAARRQIRPRVPVRLEVLATCVPREVVATDPRVERCEILRVPRIGNPAVFTPAEWDAVLDLADAARTS